MTTIIPAASYCLLECMINMLLVTTINIIKYKKYFCWSVLLISATTSAFYISNWLPPLWTVAGFSVIDRLLVTATQRAIHYEWSSEKEDWIEWNWRWPGRVPHVTAHLTETRDRIALVMLYKEQWMSTLSPHVVDGDGVSCYCFLFSTASWDSFCCLNDVPWSHHVFYYTVYESGQRKMEVCQVTVGCLNLKWY